MEPRQSRQRGVVLYRISCRKILLTDWQLADELKVSVATIRLDRMALDIPELRERARMIQLVPILR